MDATELINRHKNKLFNIVLILLALIISSKIYNAQDKAREALREQINEETRKNELLRDISSMDKRIGLYKNLFINKDADTAINTLGTIARESNVKIVSIRPAGEQRFPEYIRIPFELNVNVDSYHPLGRFISIIENQQGVYMVDSVSISTSNQGRELNVNLKVSTIILVR